MLEGWVVVVVVGAVVVAGAAGLTAVEVTGAAVSAEAAVDKVANKTVDMKVLFINNIPCILGTSMPVP